jgi:uncharacterized protein with ParB-like and HNH nuclease domain
MPYELYAEAIRNPMSLETEIKASARTLSTDSYEMSVGELINVYRDGELIVNPEFQRLFRWNITQKSHLVESLLIGVPLPSIFVFELGDGKWELIDGLQRVSTILEFAGILVNAEGKLYPPSILEGTRYLPSLEGVSWDGDKKNKGIGSAHQIAIKRSRISLQILRKTSDEKAKYDLFQRLNSHGSVATPQELRNCILFMLNKDMFRRMKFLASDKRFLGLMHPSDRLSENQAMLDYLTRYLVFTFVDYDKAWDIEEYLNNGLIEISEEGPKVVESMLDRFERTIDFLSKIDEPNILRRYKDGKFQGKVGQAAFETIFLGVSKNLDAIVRKKAAAKYIVDRSKALWARADVADFTRAGLRGTDRIQKTIPFGMDWFSK